MSNKTNPTENVSQTSVNTKTSTRPTENVRQTAKHSKPKEHSPRITLMLIIFLMMLTVACLNHTALNTVTIIVFVLAELIAMVLPEIKVNKNE